MAILLASPDHSPARTCKEVYGQRGERLFQSFLNVIEPPPVTFTNPQCRVASLGRFFAIYGGRFKFSLFKGHGLGHESNRHLGDF